MTTDDEFRKRAADAERKLVDEAKEGKVPLGKWKKFKAQYPDGTMEDYKRIRKREKEIAATTKPKFGASTKPAKINVKKAAKTAPPQAKNPLGTTPDQQDDLLRANQMSFLQERGHDN